MPREVTHRTFNHRPVGMSGQEMRYAVVEVCFKRIFQFGKQCAKIACYRGPIQSLIVFVAVKVVELQKRILAWSTRKH